MRSSPMRHSSSIHLNSRIKPSSRIRFNSLTQPSNRIRSNSSIRATNSHSRLPNPLPRNNLSN